MTLRLTTGRESPIAFGFDPHGALRSEIGIELTPRRSDGRPDPNRPPPGHWSAVRLDETRVAIHVRCAGARRVELRGDLSEWAPLAMSGVGGGWWEAVVHVDAGIHEVQLRVDGGPWVSPAGLPVRVTGVDGAHGIAVID
jgi:hypothetical protein